MVEEGVSGFLISHYPTLINWQEFKLTSLSVLPMTVTGKSSHCPYIDP